MRLAITISVALLAGAVGFYAGLAGLLTATGLDSPGWAPVTMVAGAGLFGAIAAAVASRLGPAQVAAAGAVVGLAGGVLGLAVMGLADSFEAAAAGAATLVLAAAGTVHALAA